MNEGLSDHGGGSPVRPWMRRWMMAAAIYNFVWGGLVVLFPFLLFDALNLARPTYPQIWQCVGMIVGVYGVGYWIAARDPIRWWPLVLVGLLGKILGPIGFVWAILFEGFPAAFGWTILTNDLIWWVPFSAILLAAWHHHSRPQPESGARGERNLAEHLAEIRLNDGSSLAEVSVRRPVMLVFLRHLGCTFCRQTLDRLSSQRQAIEAKGTEIVLVHPDRGDAEASRLAERFGVGDLLRISDPECGLYRAAGLERMPVSRLFHPRLWWQGIHALFEGWFGRSNRARSGPVEAAGETSTQRGGVHRVGKRVGYGIGPMRGDGFQMPGVLVIRHSRVVWAFLHRMAGDQPDLDPRFCGLESCDVVEEPQPKSAALSA